MRLQLAITCYLLSIVAGACVATPNRPAELASIVGGIWMHVDGDWVSSPPDPDIPRVRSAPATLVHFSSDGGFSMLRCYVIEHANTLAISRGDPHMIYIGQWSQAESGIRTRHRLMYEKVQPVGGGKYPGPEETSTASMVGKALHINGKRYIDVSKQVDAAEYEEFIAPVRKQLTTN